MYIYNTTSNTRIINILSGYNIAIYIIKMNAMTTVIILRSIWGGRVCTFMIA